jgi:hypothetical protein
MIRIPSKPLAGRDASNPESCLFSSRKYSVAGVFAAKSL